MLIGAALANFTLGGGASGLTRLVASAMKKTQSLIALDKISVYGQGKRLR
jgi:hypothetical protein